MRYLNCYGSPLGKITLAFRQDALCGLWFVGQKYFGRCLDGSEKTGNGEIVEKTKMWLDIYFSGREPDFVLPLHISGTEFQKRVWNKLLTIPYGTTMTYGEIASSISNDRTNGSASPRAVGGAVGRNDISIVIPCHRVIGAGRSLTGYAGGLDKKISLLRSEHIDISRFHLPKGT